ncbi:MAG: NirD/YgiW/YdeI family stress tolerance protein [Spirochaetaceae bacterium]|jgi:uncharacterized protein (TIGR00156 family)|nr:NirD/YgiW/YdeI family stress tolerance protein [Spirochaetaceae bacterium]
MKKIGVFVLMVALSACMIDADEWGGFSGPSSFVVRKVSEVKNLPDDTHVILEGKIERELSPERYLFNDGSDTITVDIDRDEWRGLTVNPDDVVILYGEVDRSFQGVKIEVDRIEKKPASATATTP